MIRARPYLIVLSLVALQALVLFSFGQPPICTCGYVKLWEGDIRSSGMSQHLTDWYTFSHIIHGFLFYMILRYLFPKKPVLWRVAIAVGAEVGWEILENTPMVIHHYREQALARGYAGDSILNSISDTGAMMTGFFLSWKLQPRYIIAIAIFLELCTLYFIRDNLTLNVINLIHVMPSINAWQAGA
jgi:hypothetical protein